MKITLLPFLLIPFLATSCDNNEYDFKGITFAVFADNQIHPNTPQYTGFLKNHLKLCKEKGVDAIMIPGDLVNNADQNQYVTFENALKEIYGDDETNYPEFIYSMGNHEWYTNDERTDENAVYLFNRHARIKTDSLVKRTTIKTTTKDASYYGNYYKVINDIPFVAISGESPSGILSYYSRDEIKSWLKEIQELPSVKAGGPIFVGYHYAFPDVTYSFGQGGAENARALYDILKEYPQVILFSGDTHYSGVNERTINQVDFTDINLGSSSYSRHVSRSVTMGKDEYFANINQASYGKDTLIGEVAEGYNKTPHIHFVTIDKKGNTCIDRYFSTSDVSNPIHLGLQWNISSHPSKDTFVYTSKRYENKDWANKMYGKDGLLWNEDASLDYSVNSGNMTIYFPDVIDYNYCEHYRIIITSNDEKTYKYDFVSHYYKSESNSHQYSFPINDIDFEIKKVEVFAYDFFDNISINHLEKII